MKLLIVIFYCISCFSLHAQFSVKVKKEDNRLLFFQVGTKADTIVKNKSDKFVLHFPDSLKNNISVFLSNGQLVKTESDSIYLFRPVPGMKYSHSKPDTAFVTLLEGNCPPSKIITVEFINTQTQSRILLNKFMVK
jgi:hypothetical protein